MRIAERYIIKEWLKSFLFSLGIICFFYILSDLFSHIDELIRAKSSIISIAKYYLYSLPLISIYLLIPLSTVIATSFCFSNLMRNQEIIVLRTAGWNLFMIIRPILMTLLVFGLVFLYFTEIHFGTFIERYQELKRMTQEAPTQKKERVIENVTYLSGSGKVIFARKFINNRLLEQILVLDQTNLQKIQADKGEYIDDDFWHLTTVYIHHMTSGKVEFFDSIDVALVDPLKLGAQSDMFFEMHPSDMIKERITYFSNAGADDLVKIWKVELYKKHAICFFGFFLNLSLVGLFLKIRKRQNLLSNFGIGLFVSFIFYVAFSIFIALGKAGYMSPLLSVWFTPFIFCVWGIMTLLSLP